MVSEIVFPFEDFFGVWAAGAVVLCTFLITWHRVEFISEEMVFLRVDMSILSKVGIKLVPLLRIVVSSDGRLMDVKLWTLLVVESLSCSSWIRDCR